ncbi:hypothetical protein GCM10022219_09780 [Microbacterium oryzae]
MVRCAHLLGMSDISPVVPDFLTQHQVAEKLQVPERTLEDWRLHHVGPPFSKLGRHVRYADVDVAEWTRAHRHG